MGIRFRRSLFGGDLQQHRYQTIEALPRQRRKMHVSRAAARALQRRDQRFGITKAPEREKRNYRGGGVFPCAPEGAVVIGGARSRPGIAENHRELRLDVSTMERERVLEVRRLRITERFREQRTLVRVVGQLLRLTVVAILEPMLDAAQEAVRVP